MKRWDLLRRALMGCAPAVLLAGCGASAPSPAGPGMLASPRDSAPTGRDGSWMLPEARTSKLIYAGGFYGNVYVYDYDTGKKVGTLKANSDGMCVDAEGDVYVTQLDGDTLEYAHGGTEVLKTFSTGESQAGCSVDASHDLAVTNSTAANADVTVFAGGDPSMGTTYSHSGCKTSLFRMGYDGSGNLMGEGDDTRVVVCALLAGARKETTLAMRAFTINVPGGTMWDGQYVALSDQMASGQLTSGIVQASLSGKTLTSHGETLLTDTCSGGKTDIGAPFIVGRKNTPVNHRQGKVAVAVNSICEADGKYLIEFWHYPAGGNPFKSYRAKTPLTGVVVSIGR